MKRYKYGLNSQVSQTSDFFQLVTLGMVDVVPGDTFSGSSTIRLISESTTKPILNRTYHDTFMFYVPYRLLWDAWPDFIAGDDTQTIPVITSPGVSPYKRYLAKGTANSPNQFNAFGEMAYNLIWNKFFRIPEVPEVPLTATDMQGTPLRPTTFNQRLKDATELLDQVIDTTSGSITTQDLRQAFSQDRFNKTRAYYGDKYTDYLAALGVEASWSILDEPELIGMHQQKLNFVMTDATAELSDVETDPNSPNYVGSVGGKWQGSNTVTSKKTFCPEHGLIMVMGTTRMDLELVNSKGWIGNLKQARDQYYSPEWETERKQAWFPYWNAVLAQPPVEGTELFTEKFDDYRNGQNIQDRTDTRNGTWIEGPDVVNPQTVESIRYQDASTIAPFLNDQYAGIQINLLCNHRHTRVSPIRPSQSVHGVS